MLRSVCPILLRLKKHRVGALGAEIAFFGLLSIPSLLIGFVATAGLIARLMGPETVNNATDALLSASGSVFSADVTTRLVRPSIDQVLTQTKFSALSIGYFLAIWSGSRMINAVYQGAEILSEQDSHRSSIETRLRAIKTLVLGFLAVSVGLPLLLAGPRIIASLLPWYFSVVGWMAVAIVAVVVVAWVMREAIPQRPRWRPALVASIGVVLGWALASLVLQWWLGRSTGGGSLYGPLSAPIALLMWLEVMAVIFLITLTVIAMRESRSH